MAQRRSAGLDRLRSFLAVAEAGGFTAAATRLGVVKSAISEDVRRLEAELGVALFTRSTRRIALTEAGERLRNDSAPLIAGLDDALAAVAPGAGGRLAGRLRITAPADYAASVLAPLITAFAMRHEALEIEVLADDRVLDLVREGIDLAVRIGRPRDESLQARHLGTVLQAVVASPDLHAARTPPRSPAELAEEPWVLFTGLGTAWTFTSPSGQPETVRVTPRLRCNAAATVLAMVRAGLGCTISPDYMVAQDIAAGRLRQLVADWVLPAAPVHAVYPATRHVPAKVRAFIDAMVAGLAPQGAPVPMS